MLKFAKRTIHIAACFSVLTGAAGAALTVSQPHVDPVTSAGLATPTAPTSPTSPGYCKTGGNWVSVNAIPLHPTSVQKVIAEAIAHDVVLLGEQHDLEDHHVWQLQMLSALHAQAPNMVIGFEMFPRRTQAVLDQWVAGSLSAQDFLKLTEWDKVWTFSPHLYMPLFEFARINKIPMRALNVDRELSRTVAQKGWDNVPEEAREGVDRPAAALPEYLELLRQIYQMHAETAPGGGAKKESTDAGFKNFVDSQLTWDRAMAQALALAVGQGGHKSPTLVVGIMGSGHIRHGHGVPHQLKNLGIQKIASLLPVSLDEECRDLEAGVANAVFVLPNQTRPPPVPPRLGVALEDAAQGLTVSGVTVGSLAEKTGLRVGDRITQIAGRAASGSADAVATIRQQPPGTWLPLRITRGQSTLDLVVQFPPRP